MYKFQPLTKPPGTQARGPGHAAVRDKHVARGQPDLAQPCRAAYRLLQLLGLSARRIHHPKRASSKRPQHQARDAPQEHQRPAYSQNHNQNLNDHTAPPALSYAAGGSMAFMILLQITPNFHIKNAHKCRIPDFAQIKAGLPAQSRLHIRSLAAFRARRRE